MKMFRGMDQEHVYRRLMLRGWPQDAAKTMAAFLCEPSQQLPRWDELAAEKV